MSVLPDYIIRSYGSDLIEPFQPSSVQPASYDLMLDGVIRVPSQHETPLNSMDLRRHQPSDQMRVETIAKEGFRLEPKECILGSTVEVIKVPSDLSARVEGKSSLGRVFLAIHVTAGFIDPGFQGQITLEIVNLGPWSVTLWPGMKIAQVSFSQMVAPARNPYGTKDLGSHYQGQTGPTPASGNRGDP